MNDLQMKMNAVINDLHQKIAEREDLIRCIAIALLARKNLFILGDTGQAKSYAITEFCRSIRGSRQFTYQVSKQTTEEQLFGRLNLSSLIPGSLPDTVLMQDAKYREEWEQVAKLYTAMNDPDQPDKAKLQAQLLDALKSLELCRRALVALKENEPVLITAGKIPDAHIVFLDELFKSNDTLLDTLLTAFNEHCYTNEGKTSTIPTISFFAASNEIPNFDNPEEAGLRPLYDRLDLKLVTQYIQSKENRQHILAEKQSGYAAASRFIDLEELFEMQKQVDRISVPDAINELADQILCELREKEIHVSDRRFFGYYPIVQALAWLEGRDAVIPQDLLILQYYFWSAPGEIETVQQVLHRLCENPLSDNIAECELMLAEAGADFERNKGDNVSQAIIKLRSDLAALYTLLKGLESSAYTSADQDAIAVLLERAESVSRTAHDFSHFTYVPLSELAELQ